MMSLVFCVEKSLLKLEELSDFPIRFDSLTSFDSPDRTPASLEKNQQIDNHHPMILTIVVASSSFRGRGI